MYFCGVIFGGITGRTSDMDTFYTLDWEELLETLRGPSHQPLTENPAEPDYLFQPKNFPQQKIRPPPKSSSSTQSRATITAMKPHLDSQSEIKPRQNPKPQPVYQPQSTVAIPAASMGYHNVPYTAPVCEPVQPLLSQSQPLVHQHNSQPLSGQDYVQPLVSQTNRQPVFTQQHSQTLVGQQGVNSQVQVRGKIVEARQAKIHGYE